MPMGLAALLNCGVYHPLEYIVIRLITNQSGVLQE